MRLRIYETSYKVSDQILSLLKQLGYDGPDKLDLLCICSSRNDANRQCKMYGLGDDIFTPSKSIQTNSARKRQVMTDFNFIPEENASRLCLCVPLRYDDIFLDIKNINEILTADKSQFQLGDEMYCINRDLHGRDIKKVDGPYIFIEYGVAGQRGIGTKNILELRVIAKCLTKNTITVGHLRSSEIHTVWMDTCRCVKTGKTYPEIKTFVDMLNSIESRFERISMDELEKLKDEIENGKT